MPSYYYCFCGGYGLSDLSPGADEECPACKATCEVSGIEVPYKPETIKRLTPTETVEPK